MFAIVLMLTSFSLLAAALGRSRRGRSGRRWRLAASLAGLLALAGWGMTLGEMAGTQAWPLCALLLGSGLPFVALLWAPRPGELVLR